MRYVFSWRSPVKYLGKFDIRISYVFIRLILPIFFFEVVSCTKNVYKVQHEWQWQKNKIGHENDVKIVERYGFY